MLHLTKSRVWLQRWKTPLTKSQHNAKSGTDCSNDKPDPELDVAWTPDDRKFGTASTGGGHYASICDTAAIWSASRKAMASKTNRAVGDPVHRRGHAFSDPADEHPRLGLGAQPVGQQPAALPPGCRPALLRHPAADQARSRLCRLRLQGTTALERPGLIGFSLSTMRATSWNPGRSRQRSMHNTMFFTSLGMCIGSDGDDAAGEPHNDLVCFPFVGK